MKKEALPFGTVLGFAPGNVAAYSSDYKSVDPNELPDRHAYRHSVNGIYTGYKWQCVEFARRWLLLNKGYVFDDIAMAYDIFRLPYVTEMKSGKRLPLYSFENGSFRHPEPGCMLIWSEGGEFDVTGHVAIVTEVFADRVRIAEQNLDHQYWGEGQHFSRELPATISEDGSFWIQCSFRNAEILGWVMQTADASEAVVFEAPAADLFNLKMRQTAEISSPHKVWLNPANPDEAAYLAMNGSRLSSVVEDQYKYLVMSETAEAELKRATNELHALFMHATDYVLQHEKVLAKFNLPTAIWPRLHQSWNNRRNQM
ncbi:MAG: CHAP domain-containing protein, partial [Pseudomonadales bacterium]|nr:CHAP domain-containing protein [Pseudomonadales bacterium]